MLDKLKNRLNHLAEQAQAASAAAEEEFQKIKISEDERNKRYDICKSCDQLFEPTSTCKLCLCFMAVKTYLPAASCPMNKWAPITIVHKDNK